MSPAHGRITVKCKDYQPTWDRCGQRVVIVARYGQKLCAVWIHHGVLSTRMMHTTVDQWQWNFIKHRSKQVKVLNKKLCIQIYAVSLGHFWGHCSSHSTHVPLNQRCLHFIRMLDWPGHSKIRLRSKILTRIHCVKV